MARWVGAQSQVNLAKKVKTHPHCDIIHKTQYETFFKNLN